MIIAGVSIEKEKIPELVKLGVKDSKLLSPGKRTQLSKRIKELASGLTYVKVDPPQIDRFVFHGEKLFKLNYLEARMMASVLHRLNSFDLAYVDCCDTNQKRFGYLISDLIAEKNGLTFTVGEMNPLFEKITSENHADGNYPIVSAASIIAKVTRDSCVRRLRKKHGEFGSGYPSDPETVSFLKKSYEDNKCFPPFTRLSWLTVRRMQGLTDDEEEEINEVLLLENSLD